MSDSNGNTGTSTPNANTSTIEETLSIPNTPTNKYNQKNNNKPNLKQQLIATAKENAKNAVTAIATAKAVNVVEKSLGMGNDTTSTNTNTNTRPKNNTKTNNAKMNNAKAGEEVQAVQTQLQQNASSLQKAIDGGDCKVINDEVQKVIKSGNSIMSMINAGKAKEEDFSNLKGQLQTATTNIKAKCPPTQAGGKRKTRKQKHKHKARKSSRRV